MKLTQANEDYLEAIVMLSDHGKIGVRSVDIAKQLDVSKPSVNKALALLKKHDLIEQEPYGDIYVTQTGIEYGQSVLRRHNVLTVFLRDILGADPEVAEDEACMLEHSIDDDTFAKWEAFVDKILAESSETAQS